MLQYNPTVTGSLQVSGDITGTVNGINITGLSQSVSTQLISVQVSTGSSDAKFETLSGVTSSALTRLTNIETKSASVDISISNINSITASNIARLSNLETKSSSVDISLSSINSKTGSYATTGSNQFYGTQVFSGSVYIANDLIVQGSSSIQYISASSVSIGTNIVQLNTANPSVRFAGLSIIDSGSLNGVTSSLMWDSVCNGWIYGRESGSLYRGGAVISGPRNTTGVMGCEQTTTACMLMAGQGGDHITSSMIYTDTNVTCIPNILIGSTICAPKADFTSDASCVSVRLLNGTISGGSTSGNTGLYFGDVGSGVNMIQREKQSSNTAAIVLYSEYGYNTQSKVASFNYGGSTLYTGGTARLTIDNNGYVGIGTNGPCTFFDIRTSLTFGTCGTVANSFPLATFAINSSDNGCRGLQIGSTSGGISGAPVFLKVFGTSAPFAILNQSNCAGLTIDANNLVTFVCKINTPFVAVSSIDFGGGATSPSTSCVGYGMFGLSGVGLGITAGATGGNQGMAFFTCGDYERMRLTTSGYLGIGCTTPAYLLDVNGKTRLCGNVGIRVVPSSAGDQYLTTGDAGITYTNSYFGTGQVRIGGGSDHATNTVFSVAPGVVTFDRPGVGGGALKIDCSGNVGINKPIPLSKLHINGTRIFHNSTQYGRVETQFAYSAFTNPTISLFTHCSTDAYAQATIRVTVFQNGISGVYGNVQVGYAVIGNNPYTPGTYVSTMTAVGGSNLGYVGTLAWNGCTLQYTTNRFTNYDQYAITVEWGGANMGTDPTYNTL